MKKQNGIFLLLLFLFSLGLNGVGYAGNFTEVSKAEIQPVHQNDRESFPPVSAHLGSSSAETETILHNLNHFSRQISESNSNEEEFRDRVEEGKSKREGKGWLIRAEVIERSLTFRELIYPHHFHF